MKKNSQKPPQRKQTKKSLPPKPSVLLMVKKAIYSFSCIVLALISFVLSNIYCSQEERIFKSKTLPQEFVFDYPGQFEEVFLNSSQNAVIHGLHFKAKASKGVVLYFHGRGWNLGDKRAGIPEDFLTRGYDLFIIDYRGFGKSRGPRSEEAIHHDATRAYLHLLKQYSEDKITVYGMSFGTGVAARLAAHHNPHQLILEAPYTSMLDMAEKSMPYLPRFVTSAILNYHLRTDEYITRINCPIHIFHGTHDKLIPYSSAQTLFKKIKHKPKVKLTSIQKGDHNHLPSYKEYTQALDNLLY